MKDFEAKEFKHPELMDTTFLLFLEKVRELADFTFVLTNDGRTPEENTRLLTTGASPNSLHLKGRAVDFKWPKEKPWREFAILTKVVPIARDMLPNRFGYELELVLDGHVHLGLFFDDRPDSVIIAAT
jgi:hypothetical protein